MTNNQASDHITPKKYFFRSVIFLGMSLAAAALNYVYYPVIAHFLSVTNFGAAQTLLAILLQVGAVFAGLNLVSIYLVHKLNDDDATKAIGIMQRITVSVFVFATLLVIASHRPVMGFLHINRASYLLLVGLALLTSIPFIVSFGYLQAKKRFVAAGALQLLTSSVKLVIGALATYKFGVVGALLGFSIGQVAALGLFWVVCKIFHVSTWGHGMLRSFRPPTRQDLKFIHPLSGNISAIFILNVLLGIFISFDLLAARHYFVPELSGLYAGASTLSNAIIFACLPLISVLLPHLEKEGLHQNIRSVARTLAMVIAVIAGSLTVFGVGSKLLLGFFGSEYKTMSYLLVRLGVMMGLLALVTLTLQVNAFYYPKTTAVIAVLGLSALLAVASTHHTSPEVLVVALTLTFTGILCVGLIELIRTFYRGKTE